MNGETIPYRESAGVGTVGGVILPSGFVTDYGYANNTSSQIESNSVMTISPSKILIFVQIA